MTDEFPDGISWNDVSVMDEWIGLNGGLFFNVERSWRGRRVVFTLKLDKGEIEPVVIGSNDPKRFNTEKFRFVPPETQPSLNVLEIRCSFKEVFDFLVNRYNDFLYLFESEYYELIALGAMSTYFREVFYTYPYFDFYAREYNCGKTTAMKCLIWSSFYGFLPLDPTGPVLFRAIDGCHSAIGLDELDNVIQDESGRSNIIGLLNAAYQKGNPAYRVDMERGGEIVAYDPFGLKAFTHTSPLPASFSSRSIVIVMYRAPQTKEQLRTPESFKEARDMMYRLRLDRVPDVDVSYDYVLKSSGLSNRARDRFAPILTMAHLISADLYERMLNWAIEYERNETPASFDEIDRTLIEVLRDMGEDVIMLSELRKKWNEVLQERELAGKDYGSRTLQNKLDSFGFAKSDYRPKNRVHYEISPKRLIEWMRIYGLPEHGPEDNPDNNDNPDKHDNGQELLVTNQGTQENESKKTDKEVTQVTRVTPKRVSGLDKYIVDNKSGSSFEPSTTMKEDLNSWFWKAIQKGYVEEEKVGGPYRLTELARERIKELGY